MLLQLLALLLTTECVVADKKEDFRQDALQWAVAEWVE